MKYIAQSTVIDYKDNCIRKDLEKIFETPFGDFDVCADDRGNIFVLCQDKENGIHLITISGKDVNEKCLLRSKITEGYEKHFNAEYVNGWINALYTIKHDGKNLIIHHTVNSDTSPFVLDSLENETKLFLFKDAQDNLYAVYKNEKIGYRKFEWKSKKWGEFTALCQAEGELLFADGDFTSEPEFVFSLKDGNNVSVYCGEEEIISGIREEVMPVIINYRRELIVLFEYQGRILQSIKKENGEFSRPKYAYFGSLTKYELLVNLFDTYKIKTYGNMTPRGTYRSLLMVEPPQKEEIKEPEPMPEEKSTEKKYDEIIKLLENKNEYEILANILGKLNAVEKVLEEMKNGNTFKQE